MSCSEERYKLCRRCVEESDFESKNMIFADIDYRIQQKDVWLCPMRGEYRGHWFFVDRAKLCLCCPYKLEHIALVQNEVPENDEIQ